MHKTLQQYLKYNTKNNFHACLYFMMSILSRFTLLLNFFFFHWTLIFIFKVQSLTVDWRFAFHCRKTDVAQWKNSSNTLTLTVWFLLVLNWSTWFVDVSKQVVWAAIYYVSLLWVLVFISVLPLSKHLGNMVLVNQEINVNINKHCSNASFSVLSK